MNSQDVYLQMTFPNGSVSFSEHTVYDKQKFVDSRVKYFSTRDKPEDNATISVVTRQDYQRGTGKRVF